MEIPKRDNEKNRESIGETIKDDLTVDREDQNENSSRSSDVGDNEQQDKKEESVEKATDKRKDCGEAEHRGFGGGNGDFFSMQPQEYRMLRTNDSVFLNIRNNENEGNGVILNTGGPDIDVPEGIDSGVVDSPAIRLGDPTLSMVNEFMDYETKEKQKRLKRRGFWGTLFCVFTCGMCRC
ncbi:hypothetical protein PAEPH01_1596 [Pancytospora epiphaga]|nr:hypothetical protein PAEPH01_1596 [Pancytospora epiphaga]